LPMNQSLLFLSNPIMVVILPVLEWKIYLVIMSMLWLKKNNLMMMKWIILMKFLLILSLKPHKLLN
jgi:hypothetical protein